MSARGSRRRLLVAVIATAAVLTTTLSVAVPEGTAATATAPSHAYRANDYADGRAMSILPPGENGLVTAKDAAAYEASNGAIRPANSQDQLGKYNDLLYGYPNLTDSTLSNWMNWHNDVSLEAEMGYSVAPRSLHHPTRI